MGLAGWPDGEYKSRKGGPWSRACGNGLLLAVGPRVVVPLTNTGTKLKVAQANHFLFVDITRVAV